MKIEAQINTKVEKKETNLPVSEDESQILTKGDETFSDLINPSISINNIDDTDIPDADCNYDSLMMSIEDAMFFINLVQNGNFSVETPSNAGNTNIIQLEVSQTSVSQKTVEVTNTLNELIEKAQKTQKPVRITFDNDVSVIIKIDKHGKLTAEFIPGSAEVENYLRNNIPVLRQKFEEQNLPYNDLLYRQNSRQNRDKDKNNRGER